MEKFIIRPKRKHVESPEDAEKLSKHLKGEGSSASISAAGVKIEGQIDTCHFLSTKTESVKDLDWHRKRGENLSYDYCIFFTKSEADAILKQCDQEITWNTGRTAQVHLFGKWLDIPRKQSAHGDPGLSYTFSGNSIPAQTWTPVTSRLRDLVNSVTGNNFNFVLINRYCDGNDYMGFHKDDEADLDPESPIASFSFGQARDFVFKHQDSRGKNATRKIDDVSQTLQSGSLLLMNYPTNRYWYHALPRRKRALGTRINMTFRKMVQR